MNAHSAQLTKMKLSDRVVMLKPVSKAKNPILMKRKNMFKLSSFLTRNNPTSAASTDGDRTRNDEAIKSLRDVIAFCMLPPPPTDGAAGW
ncbi:WD repeat-containing protein 89 [Desmophyllum pertusum]|uniref:WD repeat-containing protein 89 n=1 Tax=Desmophyllum pertusum TaxID=174260 RepID=A0A9X0D4X3_9CNID|nr:WD repeat-containing protein 89 [Desmophyllum pertusum]